MVKAMTKVPTRRFYRKERRQSRSRQRRDADEDDLKLGKFFKRIFRTVTKIAPFVIGLGTISPTLFGTVGSKTALGKVLTWGQKAGRALFFTKKNGKWVFDPKKAALVMGGLSMLDAVQQQRRAENLAQQAMAQQAQYVGQVLGPATQWTNTLFGVLGDWALNPNQLWSLYGTPQFFSAFPEAIRQAALQSRLQGGG